MNWQKISIERLREYEARKQAAESIPEQIETLNMAFTSVRSAKADATAVRGGNGNAREDALINNIVMREELQRNLDIAMREIQTTEKGLEGLTKDQKRILHKFYIERKPGHVEDLCAELCIERSRVYTLKDEALKAFTVACYGVVEI